VTEVSASADGRRTRRLQNESAVVDAVLDLIAEGNLRPGAAEIAERSGVSQRSLFRYFEDLDHLAAVAVERQAARADHLFEPLDTSGSLDERVLRLVEHRLALWRAIGPVLRSARLRAPFQPAVAAGLAHRRDQLRAQLRGLFSRELEAADAGREPLVVALELVSGFTALEDLLVDRGLPQPRAGAVMGDAVRRLLTR
jgi:TetR/AcrR family transcriptional regulator, regulator of autoinduction and epiphytic fitness